MSSSPPSSSSSSSSTSVVSSDAAQATNDSNARDFDLYIPYTHPKLRVLFGPTKLEGGAYPHYVTRTAIVHPDGTHTTDITIKNCVVEYTDNTFRKRANEANGTPEEYASQYVSLGFPQSAYYWMTQSCRLADISLDGERSPEYVDVSSDKGQYMFLAASCDSATPCHHKGTELADGSGKSLRENLLLYKSNIVGNMKLQFSFKRRDGYEHSTLHVKLLSIETTSLTKIRTPEYVPRTVSQTESDVNAVKFEVLLDPKKEPHTLTDGYTINTVFLHPSGEYTDTLKIDNCVITYFKCMEDKGRPDTMTWIGIPLRYYEIVQKATCNSGMPDEDDSNMQYSQNKTHMYIMCEYLDIKCDGMSVYDRLVAAKKNLLGKLTLRVSLVGRKTRSYYKVWDPVSFEQVSLTTMGVEDDLGT